MRRAGLAVALSAMGVLAQMSDGQPAAGPAPASTEAAPLACWQAQLGPHADTLQTEHFVLLRTADEAAAREISWRLEAVYQAGTRLARELGVPVRRPPHRLVVIVLGDYREFRTYRSAAGLSDQNVLGFFDPLSDCSVFFDLDSYPPVAQLRADVARLPVTRPLERRRRQEQLQRRSQALLMSIVQHEAAHHVLFDLGLLGPAGAAPIWLAEGLAEMFELPFVERGATLELSTNRYRLAEYSRLYADERGLGDELRRLITGDDQWRGGADYPLAWSLTNYLYKRQRADLAAWLRALADPSAPVTGPPADRLAGFESYFGPADEVAARLAAYMRRVQARFERPTSLPVGRDP